MIEKTVKKVLPGQPGTKKLMKKYGEQLVCLRYKYDSKRGHKLKTVELVIEEMPWHKSPRKIPANKNVFLTVAYGEIHLGRLVRHAGGKWQKDKTLWELPYGEAAALGLEERIVSEIPDNRN